MVIGVKRRFYMPEMPKWLIVLVAVVACWWIFSQVTSFVGKVGTTVDKANSSMSQSHKNIQAVGQYE